ncbi:hypothetical protein AB4305_16235 [Nocardia sp. 2YAB30]|uniref:hypothetical protein n=1 Tax=unclassified Nocardia TaxID=2637762 RepID=UPI003F9DBBF5
MPVLDIAYRQLPHAHTTAQSTTASAPIGYLLDEEVFPHTESSWQATRCAADRS